MIGLNISTWYLDRKHRVDPPNTFDVNADDPFA